MFNIEASIRAKTLRKDVIKYVEMHERSDNVKLYHALISVALYADDADELDDVLDAMSGWCHPMCRIGTGDYH